MTLTADPRAARGWWKAGELRRPARGEVPLNPPAPLLSWRDVPHRGIMRQGMCCICWGFADDPRHSASELVAASRGVVFTTTYSLATRA